MKIGITNVHLHWGGNCRGTDRGPGALRDAGLLAALKAQGHEVAGHRDVVQREAGEGDVGDLRARFLDPVMAVCTEVAGAVAASLQAGHFPLVLGGDHSQSIGSVAGLARHFSGRGQGLGVLWVDAHADMNTPETSPSGNIHGMPLAALLGYGWNALTRLAGGRPALAAEHVVLFGVREIDPSEDPLVRRSGVRVFTKREIDQRGVSVCLGEAMAILDQASAGIHLSYDLDAVDPVVAPGVSTPVPGGLSAMESLAICEAVARSGRLIALEMVELNPLRDVDHRTARAAVRWIQAAMGSSASTQRTPYRPPALHHGPRPLEAGRSASTLRRSS